MMEWIDFGVGIALYYFVFYNGLNLFSDAVISKTESEVRYTLGYPLRENVSKIAIRKFIRKTAIILAVVLAVFGEMRAINRKEFEHYIFLEGVTAARELGKAPRSHYDETFEAAKEHYYNHKDDDYIDGRYW